MNAPRETQTTYLLFIAMGKDRTEIAAELSTAAEKAGCQIESYQLKLLGTHFILTLMLAGNWSGVAKVELALTKLSQKHRLKTLMRRTELPTYDKPPMNYYIQVTGQDQTESISQVLGFIADRELTIIELNHSKFKARHTALEMFSLAFNVLVPVDAESANLREEFMVFCDDLNLDVIMELERA